jgi:hypothetical protein
MPILDANGNITEQYEFHAFNSLAVGGADINNSNSNNERMRSSTGNMISEENVEKVRQKMLDLIKKTINECSTNLEESKRSGGFRLRVKVSESMRGSSSAENGESDDAGAGRALSQALNSGAWFQNDAILCEISEEDEGESGGMSSGNDMMRNDDDVKIKINTSLKSVNLRREADFALEFSRQRKKVG